MRQKPNPSTPCAAAPDNRWSAAPFRESKFDTRVAMLAIAAALWLLVDATQSLEISR
jgi:hypothetical protein